MEYSKIISIIGLCFACLSFWCETVFAASASELEAEINNARQQISELLNALPSATGESSASDEQINSQLSSLSRQVNDIDSFLHENSQNQLAVADGYEEESSSISASGSNALDVVSQTASSTIGASVKLATTTISESNALLQGTLERKIDNLRRRIITCIVQLIAVLQKQLAAVSGK